MRASSLHRCIVSCSLVLAASSIATGDVLWDESINGDLSGDRLNPTPFVLTLGTHSIIATSIAGDREYFTMAMAAGLQLDMINLVSYVGNDPLAFIAVQQGTVFTEPPTGTVTANLLGWTHFGTGNATLGTDILDNMGAGAGAIGFTPPLPSGDHTFWSQQTGANSVTYQLDFVVTPAPSTLVMLGLAGLMPWRRRRR